MPWAITACVHFSTVLAQGRHGIGTIWYEDLSAQWMFGLEDETPMISPNAAINKVHVAKRPQRQNVCDKISIEIMNKKARHNLMDAKCSWRSNRLEGNVSFREPLGQTKVMQIRQGETLNHQGAITHEVCCLAAQYSDMYHGKKISGRFGFRVFLGFCTLYTVLKR